MTANGGDGANGLKTEERRNGGKKRSPQFEMAGQILLSQPSFRRNAGKNDAARRLHSARAMLLNDEHLNDLTGKILSGAIEVHRILGPGLLESIYSPCLQLELTDRGLRFAVHQQIPITYKGVRLPASYFADLIVEDLVVVEIKSVEVIAPVHKAQVLTYIRLTEKPAGLLINFNAARLMDGVSRLINPRIKERS